MDHLRRSVLSRVLLAWFSVSLLALAGSVLMGYRKLNQLALEAAQAEVKKVAEPSATLPGTTESRANIRSGFILLRLYDHRGNLVFEAVSPTNNTALTEVESHLPTLPMDGFPHIRRFDLQKRPMLYLLFPARLRQDRGNGYIEGVMWLDEEALRQAKASIRANALAILISVTATALFLYPLMYTLNRKVVGFADELMKSNLEIASVLGAAIAQRDTETRDHHFRVTLYAIRFAEALPPDQVDVLSLVLGAFLHDVGKIGINDHILLKRGALTEEEQAIMRTHVLRGLDIIRPSDWLQNAREVIGYHHERFDGTGYPEGLRGKDIPLVARVFAIVDAFDALTSRRTYKEAHPISKALATLADECGTHFDPDLLAIFMAIAPQAYEEIHAASGLELVDLLEKAVEAYRRMAAGNVGVKVKLVAFQTEHT